MRIEVAPQVIHRGYDGKTCWVHARCGLVPAWDGEPMMVVTMQSSQMGTSEKVWDVFSGLSILISEDGGRTWAGPIMQEGLQAWEEADGVRVVISDFTPQWHRATGTLLGIGHTCRYSNGRLMKQPRPRETAYAVFDSRAKTWRKSQILQMPDVDRFFSCGSGSCQWEEQSNGDVLLPVYFRDIQASVDAAKPGQEPGSRVVVLRCGFDGESLKLLEIGGELQIPDARRGILEPSLLECEGRYWMTLRSGDRAYFTRSHDGLNFDEPEVWRFDDGEELGSWDTQQHWARIGKRLFLVYTRRGLNNDHVVRHRAPLAMAEVDQKRGRILRNSEHILVPNRGAQLGNFGVSQSDDGSAWICVSEWMENAGSWNGAVWSALKEKFPEKNLEALNATPGRSGLCEIGGSDNSVHLVRVAQRSMSAVDERSQTHQSSRLSILSE